MQEVWADGWCAKELFGEALTEALGVKRRLSSVLGGFELGLSHDRGVRQSRHRGCICSVGLRLFRWFVLAEGFRGYLLHDGVHICAGTPELTLDRFPVFCGGW